MTNCPPPFSGQAVSSDTLAPRAALTPITHPYPSFRGFPLIPVSLPGPALTPRDHFPSKPPACKHLPGDLLWRETKLRQTGNWWTVTRSTTFAHIAKLESLI